MKGPLPMRPAVELQDPPDTRPSLCRRIRTGSCARLVALVTVGLLILFGLISWAIYRTM